MAVLLSFRPASRFPFRAEFRTELSEATICSKCQGRGVIVLLHRPAGRGDLEACPTCDGVGLVRTRNGAADLQPATVGARAG